MWALLCGSWAAEAVGGIGAGYAPASAVISATRNGRARRCCQTTANHVPAAADDTMKKVLPCKALMCGQMVLKRTELADRVERGLPHLCAPSTMCGLHHRSL